MSFHWDFGITFQYFDLLIFGLAYNIQLAVLATLFGSFLGALLFWGRTSNLLMFRGPAQLYIEFFLAIPVLVLLVWLYFCLPIIGVSMTPFLASLTALGLSNAAFAAELFRGGAAAISKTETDVARAFGFAPRDTLRYIVFPAFVKVTLPPYITLTIDTLKYSTFAAFVTAPEALYTSNLIISKTFRPLEVYTMLGLLFVIAIIPMARWLANDENSRRPS
jgi:polar amino acid transport system permease protein